MEVLLETPSVRVIQQGDQIRFLPRLSQFLILFSLGLGATAIAYLISLISPYLDSSLGDFALWASFIIGACSLALLIIGLLQSLRRLDIDFAKGIIKKTFSEASVTEVKNIRLESMNLAGEELYSITCQLGEKSLRLVHGQKESHHSQLEQILSLLQMKLGESSSKPTSHSSSKIRPHVFLASIFMGIGAVISLTGYIFIPNLVLTGLGASFGFLFWPVGLWLFGLGVMTLFLPHFQKDIVIQQQNKEPKVYLPIWMNVLLLIYAVSYFLLCYRSWN